MKITYIGHSGFSVELCSCVLLFDYYTGRLPVWDKKKQLYVFASHKHKDHFNLRIFELAQNYEKIRFFLGSDIRLSDKYLERNRIPASVKEKITHIGKNKEIQIEKTADNTRQGTLAVPAKEHTPCVTSSDSIKIRSLRSTDAGVAFIVTVEGKTIYHAGDLNWWHWEGEPGPFNADMERAYKKEIDSLSGSCLDIAFVPLDPRLGKSFGLGMDYFLTHVMVKQVFPMHLWERYETIGEYKKTETGRRYRDFIVDIKARGEEFALWNI